VKKIIPYVGFVVYSKGVRYRPAAFCWAGQTPPKREAGDIKGWSLASRRRMREWLMTHNGPSGWSSVAIDLTFPAMPVGSPDVVITRQDAISVFRAFAMRLTRAGWGLVWRLEVQPRKKTKRADLRGIPQPHYHCIGVCPPGVDPMSARDHWLAVLGPRGAVPGAVEHAARVAVCDDWTGARIRYLHDHASKAKLEQVAAGWGRHWGVIGRGAFELETGKRADLTREQEWIAARILRKLIRRRVHDSRGVGGVNWSVLSIEQRAGGVRVCGLGWSCFLSSASLPGLSSALAGEGIEDRLRHDAAFRRAVEKRVTRVQGAKKKNVWALRLSRERSPVGWRFGVDGDRLVAAAISVYAMKKS